ncbi:hypothetical protein QE152_g4432 [Popillia japonica]|uniref:Uncharacterized protein n=1 Tax=Popillia japonica TaxID=7064 RepID=A0AAW1MYR4_POPJA
MPFLRVVISYSPSEETLTNLLLFAMINGFEDLVGRLVLFGRLVLRGGCRDNHVESIFLYKIILRRCEPKKLTGLEILLTLLSRIILIESCSVGLEILLTLLSRIILIESCSVESHP